MNPNVASTISASMSSWSSSLFHELSENWFHLAVGVVITLTLVRMGIKFFTDIAFDKRERQKLETFIDSEQQKRMNEITGWSQPSDVQKKPTPEKPIFTAHV